MLEFQGGTSGEVFSSVKVFAGNDLVETHTGLDYWNAGEGLNILWDIS
jgi:hypothetical protein